MDDELIAAHGEVPQLMPFLHLPVQSGSDRMLEAMNRRHTADDYRRVVDGCARRGPISPCRPTSSSAFPGESDADFAATLDLVARSASPRPTRSNTPRPGTPAASAADQCRSR